MCGWNNLSIDLISHLQAAHLLQNIRIQISINLKQAILKVITLSPSCLYGLKLSQHYLDLDWIVHFL